MTDQKPENGAKSGILRKIELPLIQAAVGVFRQQQDIRREPVGLALTYNQWLHSQLKNNVSIKAERFLNRQLVSRSIPEVKFLTMTEQHPL